MTKIKGKKRRIMRDYLIAFSGAAMFFVFLCFAFRSNAPADAQADIEPEMIFSLPEDLEACDPRHRPLIQWLELDDPLYIPFPPETGPNRNYMGRNWVYRQNDFIAIRRPFPTPDAKLVTEPLYHVETRTLPQATPPLEPLVRRSRLQSVPIPLAPKDPAPPPSGIYWVDQNGRVIADIPEFDLKSLPGVTLQVERPTRLCAEFVKFGTSSYRPRVLLAESPETRQMGSGNRKLDMLAIRHLMKYLSSIGALAQAPNRDYWISAPRCVTVLWNRVPGIKYRVEPDDAKEGELP